MRVKQIFWVIVGIMLVVGVMPLAAQDEEIVFGVVLVGPRTDHGWSQAHFEGSEYVTANVPGATALVFDSLNPADAPETTLHDVVQNMVDEGAQLIITTSDAFEEDTNAVAEAFPEITFVNVTGSNVLNGAPPNVGNYNGQMEWAKSIAGCAAALQTETGEIGYLGPLINAETRRHAASAYLGAKYCWETVLGNDPADLEFNVTWIGFWFNIPGVTLDPTEEANALFDNGADVVLSGIDTTEALTVAAQRAAAGESVWAIPYDYIAACTEANESCIGVPFYNWGPYYADLVQQVRDGTWEQSWIWEAPYWPDINDPDNSPIGFVLGAVLGEEDTALLDQFMVDQAAFGSDPENADRLMLWQGPLNLQDGTELAAEGEWVDPLDVWFLPLLLEGMSGAST